MRLSDFELDVMAHFWEHDQLSAPGLFQELGESRGVTYSTIKTIIDRLEAKGAIKRVDNRGRTILYRAAVGRERVRRPLVKAFLRRVFGDDLKPLFTQLIRDEKLSADEIDYLKRLLDEAGDKARRSP
jgi:BlaI family transcriptional regulator, penicillinase repressor